MKRKRKTRKKTYYELFLVQSAYQLHLTCRVYGIQEAPFMEYLHPLLKKKIVTYLVKNHGTSAEYFGLFWLYPTENVLITTYLTHLTKAKFDNAISCSTVFVVVVFVCV